MGRYRLEDNMDLNTKDQTTLTLTKEEFEEYKTRGYLRGIKYTWTEQNGVYMIYISQSSYEKLRQNMDSAGTLHYHLTIKLKIPMNLSQSNPLWANKDFLVHSI